MASFRFRLHECDGATSEAGSLVEAADLAAARLIAIQRARGMMAEEIKKGQLCLSCWIVISDERGDNVATLQFGDAIAFKSSPSCGHETEAEARRSA